MARQVLQSNVFQVRGIALAISLFCSTVSASAGGVLSQFAGDWSGEGTVTTTAGPERIRCKVHYDVAPDGTALDQTLHCASDSYKLEVKSKVSAAGTQLTGKWNEITRDTIGNISGTIANTEIKATIEGIGFTADLAISMQANRQSITINPTGATDISQVAITLKRT